MGNNFNINSTCYPEGFSSYEEYIQTLKDKGFAFDAPEKIYKTSAWRETPMPGAENVEYIRKDTLIMWARVQAGIVEGLNGRGAMLKAWDSLIEYLSNNL